IEARRPTLLKRLSKMARRHRPVMTAAVVFLLLAVVGLTVGVVLIAQQRDRAAANADEARKQRERALANPRVALDGFDEAYISWSTRYLSRQERPGPQEREFLAELLKFYERFVEANGREPTLRLETARAYAHSAGIHDQLGNRPEAREAG